jgi:hypothetical protein
MQWKLKQQRQQLPRRSINERNRELHEKARQANKLNFRP